jgi:hypothetical protein
MIGVFYFDWKGTGHTQRHTLDATGFGFAFGVFFRYLPTAFTLVFFFFFFFDGASPDITNQITALFIPQCFHDSSETLTVAVKASFVQDLIESIKGRHWIVLLYPGVQRSNIHHQIEWPRLPWNIQGNVRVLHVSRWWRGIESVIARPCSVIWVFSLTRRSTNEKTCGRDNSAEYVDTVQFVKATNVWNCSNASTCW